NCGTGRAETFNAVANAVIDWHGRGATEYSEFPPELVASYQPFTQADLSRLRAAGYEGNFRSVADGVREYLNWLNS
ncbi:MAG: ADP-glyceromanno-heptose 6-epimerase, partial [Pseudomonadota bacterium]|nr:ADP-glyceromanno-heptose 6-epimerase [Pseudomonadota bacterium]